MNGRAVMRCLKCLAQKLNDDPARGKYICWRNCDQHSSSGLFFAKNKGKEHDEQYDKSARKV